MQQREMDLRLFVRQGHGEPSTMRPPRGEKMGPLALGAEAEWVVSAPGVLPTHGYVYYDGAQLFFRSSSAQSPIHVNGQPIPEEWTAVPAPCEIRLGMAIVAITAEEPEPEVSDAAATQKIVPLLAANMVRKTPLRRLRQLEPDEMVTRQLPAEAFLRQSSPMSARDGGEAPPSSAAPEQDPREDLRRMAARPRMPLEAPTTVLPPRGASGGIAFGPRPKLGAPPARPEPVSNRSAANPAVAAPPRAPVPQQEPAPRPFMSSMGGGEPRAIPGEPPGWLRARWRQTSNAKKAAVVMLPPIILFVLLVLGGSEKPTAPSSSQKSAETAAPALEAANVGPPASATASSEAPAEPAPKIAPSRGARQKPR